MANKVVALFIYFVLVAAVSATKATENIYKACFKPCNEGCLPEKKSHSLCEKYCDEGCEALENVGTYKIFHFMVLLG